MSVEAPSTRENSHHLVLLVHGMNTRGCWIEDIKAVLQEHGFAVAPISYGFFGAPRFLAFPFLRRNAAARVLKGIRTAERVYRDRTGVHPGQMSIISHSFGTWLITQVLRNEPNIKLFRIVFCGSVVREDFDFDPILHQFKPPILNHIGTADYWPAIGESAGWGYGSIGSHGINHAAVENRWHNGFQHSDFFTKEFCERFWVPFLQGANPPPADRRQQLPTWIRTTTIFPLRWLILAIVIIAILAMTQYLMLKLGGFDVYLCVKALFVGSGLYCPSY